MNIKHKYSEVNIPKFINDVTILSIFTTTRKKIIFKGCYMTSYYFTYVYAIAWFGSSTGVPLDY